MDREVRVGEVRVGEVRIKARRTRGIAASGLIGAATAMLLTHAQPAGAQQSETAQPVDTPPPAAASQAVDASQSEVATLRSQIEELQKRLDKMDADQKKAAAAAATAAAAGSMVKADSPSVKFSGYIQGEFRRSSGEESSRISVSPFPTGRRSVTDLDVRRARLKMEAKVTDRASVTLQLDLARNVELRDAYFDLLLARNFRLRGGQFKVPLSYQILESSSHRLTPERALINLRSVPGERDRGVSLDYIVNPESKTSPVVTVAAFNGRGINQSDNNNDKDILGAVSVPFARYFSARVAYLTGTYLNVDDPTTLLVNEGVEVDKRRLSLDLQYDKAPWNVQFQYATGKGDFPTAGANLIDTDVKGGYGQVAYQLKRLPLWLVGRYQVYDRKDVANGQIDGPLIGAVYDLNKWVRFTGAFERLDDEASSGKRSLFTLRTQVRF